MAESLKTSRATTTRAKVDDDKLVTNGQKPTTSRWIDREACDLVGHESRTRLAEICGARDECPSSNLGRVKQGQAIRADCMNSHVDGRGP